MLHSLRAVSREPTVYPVSMTDPPGAMKTIGELIDFYEQHHVLMLKNWKGTSRQLRRYVTPFATLPLSGLTRRMVIEWHHAIGRTGGPHAANNALQALHGMYQKALDWELYDGKNPAHHVKKFRKVSRTRFV